MPQNRIRYIPFKVICLSFDCYSTFNNKYRVNNDADYCIALYQDIGY